jgi:hypothetical protein
VKNADTVSKFWAYNGYNTEEWCTDCNKKFFSHPEKKETYIQNKLKQLHLAFERKKEKKEWNEGSVRLKVASWICTDPNHRIIVRAPRRVRGRLLDWNPSTRVLFWKIGHQLCMIKPPRFKKTGVYRQLYDSYKADYEKTRGHLLLEKGGKGHIHNMAIRKMVKIFMYHLWRVWRTNLGLPIRDPYVTEYGEHRGIIPPLMDDGEVSNE